MVVSWQAFVLNLSLLKGLAESLVIGLARIRSDLY